MTSTPASSRSSGEPAQGAGTPDDPWERWGWLLGAVWLVFIAFPLGAAVLADRPLAWRVVGTLLVVLFAVVYIWAMWLDDQPAHRLRRGYPYLHLGLLVVITLATIPVIGLGALGLVPFILSLAGITLSIRLAIGSLVVAMGVLVVTASTWGRLGDWWFFFLIYPMVMTTLLLVRVLDRSSTRRRDAQRLLEIATERERVARDVHDVLGHSLTVVTVKAELAERLVDVDPERAKAEIAEVRSISRQALAEIRATVAGLRVARLTDELEAAQTALDGAGIELEVVGDPAEVDPRHRIVLAWALREAVTNVVRHSGASRCTVDLSESGLVVRDDGRGVRGGKEGNGIRGLRERVEGAGGTVRIEPADPGATLEVQL